MIKVNPYSPINYGTQRSLFVIFEKKAGWIRLADSAAGEIELYDEVWSASPMRDASMRLSRVSLENCGPNKGQWVPPVRADLPIWPYQADHSTSRSVYFVTRGKITHILPCPLPTNFASVPPIHIVTWESSPASIASRLFFTSPSDGSGRQPYLQLIAFGKDGVEVQEMSLAFLSVNNKGKGKARAEDNVRSQVDIGGDTGLLCRGGRWDRLDPSYDSGSLSRSHSNASDNSGMSTETLSSEESNATRRLHEGVYGWCRKGAQDWRVFWLGGSTKGTDFGQSRGV